MNIEEIVQDLNQRKEKLQSGGGQDKIDRQHEAGSLSARERIGAPSIRTVFRNRDFLQNTAAQTSE